MDRYKRQACFFHALEILLEGNVSEVPYLTHYLLDRFVLTETPEVIYHSLSPFLQ